MKQPHFQEKHPITVVDIAKSQTRHNSADERANDALKAWVLALRNA